MADLGRFVIDRAVQDSLRWPQLNTAINVSAAQLRAVSILEDLISPTERYNVSPERITIEITESVLLSNDGHTTRMLQTLKECGFALALDDFGTGYSSLAYIRDFPFDRLKIDRSFVHGLKNSDRALAIIEAVANFGRILGKDVYDKFPFTNGMTPVDTNTLELLLNRTWRPALTITGQGGMPDLVQAGNVLRPKTSLKVSLRLPPTLDATNIDRRLKELFESDAPYGARVTFEPEKGGTGWEAPKTEAWLERSIDSASQMFFGKPATTWGEGGSIPFMGMLGQRYPTAQFLITGVLGPHSNAHGPNEFLHIGAGKGVTACVAKVIADERSS